MHLECRVPGLVQVIGVCGGCRVEELFSYASLLELERNRIYTDSNRIKNLITSYNRKPDKKPPTKAYSTRSPSIPFRKRPPRTHVSKKWRCRRERKQPFFAKDSQMRPISVENCRLAQSPVSLDTLYMIPLKATIKSQPRATLNPKLWRRLT